MKFGMRKSSIRKSISARTKGKAKREIKRILIPGSHNPKVVSSSLTPATKDFVRVARDCGLFIFAH